MKGGGRKFSSKPSCNADQDTEIFTKISTRKKVSDTLFSSYESPKIRLHNVYNSKWRNAHSRDLRIGGTVTTS